MRLNGERVTEPSKTAAEKPFVRRRVLLTTVGSFGDLHPYIAIALGLKGRGHDVMIGTSPCYQRKVEQLGINFAPVHPDSDFIQNPQAMRRYMHPNWGLVRIGLEVIVPSIRQTYQDISAASQGMDLIVSHPLVGCVARLVSEVSGIAWASTMITPLGFLSAYDVPILPVAPFAFRALRKLSPRVSKPLLWTAKWSSSFLANEWYRLRAELGLPRAADTNPIIDSHSASGVLALYSEHFAPPQPDWPNNTLTTGFPIYDEDQTSGLPDELRQFLGDGPPPIVFTLGSSAAAVAGPFFELSAAAASELGCRAVLVVGRGWSRPASLPKDVIAVDYAPYSKLFPAAAALIHPGGVGTCGLALRAGRPSLIVPVSMDHFDNGARMARLGVARTLDRRKYTPGRAASALRMLLEDQRYSTAASTLAKRIGAENGVARACDVLCDGRF